MLRRVVVVLCLVAALTGCQHPPPEYVSHYAPPSTTTSVLPGPAAVAIIGGSYTAGTKFGGEGRNGWPALVAAQLGQQGVAIIPCVEAEDGSGYITPGNDNGGVFTDQIPEVVRSDDRLVIIFGPRDESDIPTEELDPSEPAKELQPGVHQTLQAVRVAAPQARIVVIGPAWANSAPPQTVLETRDVVKIEAGLTGATFVDPLADRWFVDHPDLIGSDGLHPTDSGHAYMADKLAPLIAQQLHSP